MSNNTNLQLVIRRAIESINEDKQTISEGAIPSTTLDAAENAIKGLSSTQLRTLAIKAAKIWGVEVVGAMHDDDIPDEVGKMTDNEVKELAKDTIDAFRDKHFGEGTMGAVDLSDAKRFLKALQKISGKKIMGESLRKPKGFFC